MLKDFRIEESNTSSVNKNWIPVRGKQKTVRNHYNGLKLV